MKEEDNMKGFIRLLLSLGLTLALLLLQRTIFSSNDSLRAAGQNQVEQASLLVPNQSRPTNKMAVEDSPAITDTEPPVVDHFGIANGASTSNQLTVTLQVTATDSATNGETSGVGRIKFLELEYLYEARRWQPTQISEWVDYDTIGESYPWTLVPTYGIRYIQAWAADKAGNISLIPGTDVINLLPSDEADNVNENGIVFYPITLSQGETFTAKLTPESGDPDLYIWGANRQLWYSNSYTDTETVTFRAPSTATYQIEVHGFTDAEYKLTFDGAREQQKRPPPIAMPSGEPKPLPEGPAVPLDEWPEFYDVEQPPVITDTEHPVVDEFVIANGASTTNQLTVSLQVTATDPATNGEASGVQSIRFLEFEYFYGARRWAPVQISGWMDYGTIGESYPWTFSGSYGMRYMHAWAANKAGNISLIPGTDVINLLPSDESDRVLKNGLAFYRVPLSQGELFTAKLTPESGDPDLYIWGANRQLWYSNSYTDTETVTFRAPSTAMYQVEVHGFTSAEYKLTFDETREQQKRPPPIAMPSGEPKPLPEGPALPLDEWPEFYEPDPLPPIYTLYLPLTMR